MFCDRCGKELVINASFCSYCGSQVDKNTQNLDVYDLSLLSSSVPRTAGPREQILDLAASLDKVRRQIQGMQTPARNNARIFLDAYAKLDQFRKSLEVVREKNRSLQRYPVMQGAPIGEVSSSLEQMEKAIQAQLPAIQQIAMTSQEVDRVSDTVIQSLETLSTWLKTHA